MYINEKNLKTSIYDRFKDIDIYRGVFRTRIFRVSELIYMLKSKKLQFIGGKPFKTWSQTHKSRFIESLLLGLPCDPIIIDGVDSPWFVADGAELLSAIYEYIQNMFSLDSVNFHKEEYSGDRFEKLPLMLQTRLMNLEISATIISPNASSIYRLGVYSSALLKSGKEKELWKCSEAVYRTSFKELNELATELNASSPQILLQIIIAILYANCFKTGTFDKFQKFGELRFDMFECLVLGSIDTIYSNIETFLKENQEDIRDVLNLIEENKDYLTTKTGKKLRIFIIVTTLLSLSNKKTDRSKIGNRFKKAWNKSKGKGVGYLNQDYATKSKIIYNYLNR